MSGPTGFDTPPRRTGHSEDPTRTPAHGRFATAALGPLAATTVVGLPLLLAARLDAFWQAPAFLGPAWLVILVLAAPTTALIMNKRRPLATTLGRALLIGLPQLPLTVILMWIGIWLDVRSGEITAGTDMVQVALAVGTSLAAGLGLLLVLLVAAAARLGTSRR